MATKEKKAIESAVKGDMSVTAYRTDSNTIELHYLSKEGNIEITTIHTLDDIDTAKDWVMQKMGKGAYVDLFTALYLDYYAENGGSDFIQHANDINSQWFPYYVVYPLTTRLTIIIKSIKKNPSIMFCPTGTVPEKEKFRKTLIEVCQVTEPEADFYFNWANLN